MCAPAAPTPPSPTETAAASTGTNVNTAIANAWLGNVSENTPDGSTSIDQTGSYDWVDDYTGQTYSVPTFTRNTTLSPDQQDIADQTNDARLGLASLANSQTGFLQDYLNQPVNLDNEATESRLFELGSRRLDPMFDRQNEALRTRLANQGIKAGSDAYSRELGIQREGQNDAYNQLLLSGRGQAVQEALTERNQPINEITSLMSGSQVNQPNFIGASMPAVPTTDVAGLINSNYDQRMNAWQQNNANRQNMIGGLFSMGSAFLSDERAKGPMKHEGNVDGHNVYSYNYKGEPEGAPKNLGVSAQEVEKTRPDAVMTGTDGLKRVKYGQLFGTGT